MRKITSSGFFFLFQAVFRSVHFIGLCRICSRPLLEGRLPVKPLRVRSLGSHYISLCPVTHCINEGCNDILFFIYDDYHHYDICTGTRSYVVLGLLLCKTFGFGSGFGLA